MTNLLDDDEPKVEKEQEEKVFNLVLVDIWDSYKNETIICVKKNMYDSDLKYIAISYRWGEMQEQLLETPDYTAHITSFHLVHLQKLCYCITKEPELKEVRYLWIDAISVDQQNHAKKKETVLKMSQIYEMATFILAVPDLHKYYLWYNTASREMMDLIYQYKDIIYHDIKNSVATYNKNPISDSTQQHINSHHHYDSIIQKLLNMGVIKDNEEISKDISELKRGVEEMEELRKNNEELKMEIEEKKKDELKNAYRFLAYLVEEWSNRVWVVSEYQIAKEKYMNHGTPLKYTFTSLLWSDDEKIVPRTFFSYAFTDQHNSKNSSINNSSIKLTSQVDNGREFICFLETRFIQRNHIDMMIISNATRNEDRIYAILPSWKKYKHLIKNKNTISNWKITDMQSVKLKLYELLDDNEDLWNKARLLYYSSIYNSKPVLPTFATSQRPAYIINEIENINDAHESALHYILELKDDGKCSKNNYIEDPTSVFKQNLHSIQFNKQKSSLSIGADKYFSFNMSSLPILLNQEELSKYSLVDNDDLKLIYIPYFTYNISDINHPFPVSDLSRPIISGTLLIGNMNINRWILYKLNGCETYDRPSLCLSDGYIFNVY